MTQLFALFEHATGYALFKIAEFEEIAAALPQVKASINDLGKFRSIVELIAFKPFQTAENALENINSITESIVHPDLQLFLETNVPKSKKKKRVLLGIGDIKLGSVINELLGITCEHSKIVQEILRGIRRHFENLVPGFKDGTACKSQLGLGHNYSRAKVKFNVNRVDNMIIQSISLLDQLDKDINLFTMRIREWYSFHFPELIKIVPEHTLYAQVVSIIKDRKNMDEDVPDKLLELLNDETKVNHILEVSRSSMGMDISSIDLINIECFASRLTSLIKYRKNLSEYLKSKMQNVAPSLAALIGEMVGARLICHAGSLTNLAKYPASTVQILGAEKALFRALKTRGNTPKYGLIFHSTFIGKAAKQHKGRISRFLANKCTLASRIDCFSEIPTEIFGQRLRQQVEDRLNFFETGEKPNKNIDVMAEATEEAAVMQKKILKKQLKKEKKRKLLEMETLQNNNSETVKDLNETVDEAQNMEAKVLKKLKKKEKKRKLQEMEDLNNSEMIEADEVPEEPKKLSKKEKKFKRLKMEALQNSNLASENDITIEANDTSVGEEKLSKKEKKKAKKRKLMEMEDGIANTFS